MLPKLLLMLLTIAPQGTLGIQGRVVVPATKSQGRMEIILEKSGAFLARTFSDNEGRFRFINLLDGQYVVIVKLEGYEDVREAAFFGRDGLSIMNLTMTKSTSVDSNDANALLDAYPKKAVADYEKALEYNRKGNKAKAIEGLEAVVKSVPEFYQAHSVLGTLYQNEQRFQDAEKEYNAAVQLDRHSIEPLVNLGSLYIQIAEQARAKHDDRTFGAALDEAVRALNQAIRIEPGSANAYYFLGTTYYTGGQFPKAEENLTRALQIEKGMGKAQLILANVYIKQQKWEQALVSLDAYLRDNPKAADRDQVQQTRNQVALRK